MKVFISSLISGMEEHRAGARRAIEALRHQPVMAEDFGARPSSSQVACLDGVRQSDLVVLILGTRYGTKQESGLSATHEEYRAARGNKPVLIFLQSGVPEPDQAAFIDEAGSWERGIHRAEFSTADELRDLVTRALHDYALAHSSTPLDPAAMKTSARELLPNPDHRHYTSGVRLQMAVAVGPEAQILRPAEIESARLAEAMAQSALFGDVAVFDRRFGVDNSLESGALAVHQEGGGADSEIRLWSTGDVRFHLPVDDAAARPGGIPVIIEEAVTARIAGAVGYAAWLLNHIDPTERITHVAIAAALVGQGALGWRTRAEHLANPNSGSFGSFGMEQDRENPVLLSPPHRVRAALVMDAHRIVEDLTVLLRRRWKEPGSRVRQ